MATMKQSAFIIAGLVIGMGMACGYIDTNTVNKTEFTRPRGNDTIYQLSKRYFLLEPGDTAFLYGTEACTVITNGTLTSVRSDSVYFRTITGNEEFLTVNNTRRIVYPLVYQQAHRREDLDSSGIVRYIEQSSSAVLQLAYSKGGAMVHLESNRQMVMPNPLEMGSFGTISSPKNNWDASPLMPSPVEDIKGMSVFEGRSVATKAMMLNINSWPYVVREFHYFDGAEIKTYYSLNANGGENGEEVFIVGTIAVTSHYFRDKGLIDQFQNWNIHRCYQDGRTVLTKKSIWFGRGPEGARTYNDYDTSSVESENTAGVTFDF